MNTRLRSTSWALLLVALSACSGSDEGGAPPATGGQSGGGKAGASGGAGSGGAIAGSGGSGGVKQGGQGGGGTSGGQAGSSGVAGKSGQSGAPAAGQAGQAGAGASGASGQSGVGGAGASGAGAGGAPSEGQGGSGVSGSSGQGGAAPSCKAPDVLIALDRTLTMHFTPDGAKPTDAPDYKSSKWYQAISAIEQMVSPPADATVRFGLELWPRDPGGDQCLTLAERVTDSKQATNPSCEAGEVVVPVGENQGAAIQQYLDPTATKICLSTPTGTALQNAGDYLQQKAEEGREQYVVLVTDGADWNVSCPDPNPLPIVQQLAAKGIKTFIVGFSTALASASGVGVGFLNDMACAGQTAKGFPASCKQDANGGYVALSKEASPLYLQADNGGQLASTLQSVAGSLCCGCEKKCEPPDMLFALDRTLTMHFRPDGMKPTDAPDYKSSKWYQAIAGIEAVVAPPRDSSFRFGLELWPRDPGGGKCITLAERVTDSKQATNPTCEAGEIAVPTELDQGTAIQDYLDPATTNLCLTTPTGTALITASQFLTTHSSPGRGQYVVLVTDGADWDFSCPDPKPLLIVQQLAASGIKTFVVGFSADLASGSGVGISFLNDMACAGQTAKNFPQGCKLVDGGYVAVDPASGQLFLSAQNSDELSEAIELATADLGCKL